MTDLPHPSDKFFSNNKKKEKVKMKIDQLNAQFKL